MDSVIISIPWIQGQGNIVVNRNGGNVMISSDPNNHIDRTQVVRFYTTTGNAEQFLTVNQTGLRVVLRDNNELTLRDRNGLTLTALKNGIR